MATRSIGKWTIERGSAVALAALVFLLVAAFPAAAHGVEIHADFQDGPARLELTDETGEVCLRFESTSDPAARISIAAVSSGDVVLELGDGFGTEESCQLLDAGAVDAILADVDAHELRRLQPDGTMERATLEKPLAPASETALTDTGSSATDDDDGPNLPLIFAIGAVAGVGIAVFRSRSRSPGS